MHWNVPPDVLPGSATLVRVLDRCLNDRTATLFKTIDSILQEASKAASCTLQREKAWSNYDVEVSTCFGLYSVAMLCYC